MKKFTLFLSLVLCFAMTLKSQTNLGEISGRMLTIPGCFTITNNAYFIFKTDNWASSYFSCSIYSDFTTHIADIELNCINENFERFHFYDLDNDIDRDLWLTQTLFNSDEYYEYIEINTDIFSIKSSNGNTIQTFYPDNGYHFYDGNFNIYKLQNLYYIVITEEQQGFELKQIIYRIDEIQGITKLDIELPFSVFPTIANRGQQITVELGENTNATEINVVNEMGHVVKRIPVEKGQRTVTIPTNDLGNGLNIVNTNRGNGGCKIIIK